MATASTPVGDRAPDAPAVAAPREAQTGFLVELGEMVTFGGQALRQAPGAVRYFSEALRLAGDMVKGTTLLMFVMCGFFGITVANFAFFFLRSIGGTDFIGAFLVIANTRIASMIMFGYVFTSKVCCGLCAEIGAMKVSEEVDALEAEGVDPMRYIVGTRILAALLYLPVAACVALVGVLAGEYLDIVIILQSLSPEGLLSAYWDTQSISANVYVVIADIIMGLVAVIVACYYGLRASGGAAGVGTGVARSLVINLVWVHALAGFFCLFFYYSDIGLPFGG